MPRRPCGEIEKHIGVKIRQRREALGMTQVELASMLDISFQQVQKYEQGTNKIAVSTLIEIAHQLHSCVCCFLPDQSELES